MPVLTIDRSCKLLEDGIIALARGELKKMNRLRIIEVVFFSGTLAMPAHNLERLIGIDPVRIESVAVKASCAFFKILNRDAADKTPRVREKFFHQALRYSKRFENL